MSSMLLNDATLVSRNWISQRISYDVLARSAASVYLARSERAVAKSTSGDNSGIVGLPDRYATKINLQSSKYECVPTANIFPQDVLLLIMELAVLADI